MVFIVSFLQAQETNTYLVRLSPEVDISHISQQRLSVEHAYKFTQDKNPFLASFFYLEVTDKSILEDLRTSGELLYWEKPRAQKLHFEPSDIYYFNQWHLEKIEAPSAWDIAQGDSTFVLAVVDSGVDYTHEDLKDNLAYNYDDPVNGMDDDNDGYIDNYYGWDFGSNDHDPMVDGSNFLAHGSTICGVAAASTDNELGTSSPAFNCRYLPVKITSSSGSIINTNAGILYAAQMGAKVINCSFGSFEFSRAEADIIQYVTDSMDVLVVASAGNEGLNTDVYPAALENVIGVCALDENDQKIAISNYGANFDIAAPGASIYGPYVQNDYSYKSGTSVAAAIVSGSAILLRSNFPNENVSQIRERLLNSTDDIHAVNSQYQELLGTGRLNLFSAFEYETPGHLEMDITPNPSLGTFNLTIHVSEYGNYQLSVFDVLGKLYYREDFFAQVSTVKRSLKLDHIDQGYYTVQIVGAHFEKSSGIVVVK
jgi:subtilisin family serine protease